MRPLKLFGIVALAMVVGAFTRPPETAMRSDRRSTEGSIQGYVVDAVTHKPIAAMSVLLQGKSVSDQSIVSDNSGFFKFNKLPAGDVILVCEKKGYKVFKTETQSIREGLVKITIEVQPIEDDDYDSWHPIKKFIDFE